MKSGEILRGRFLRPIRFFIIGSNGVRSIRTFFHPFFHPFFHLNFSPYKKAGTPLALSYFITGTDTDVGKTFAAAALLEAARQRDLRCFGLKPIAAGVETSAAGEGNGDALLLMAHSSVKLSYAQSNPVLLADPIAPHIAAQREGKNIRVDRLVGYCRGALMTPADLVLVEGAGGWRVPLNRNETLADLAKELQLPVILVVGMRLGCLNHALLTAEAIAADGLPLAGWVANQIDPAMSCYQENLDTLRSLIRAPLLAEIPYLPGGCVEDAAQAFEQALEHLLHKN
ncbi:MAG: dethiobiotin synthetase [Motiliproteus sp.]|jgi:dethiobiotin synthetase